MMYCLYSSLHSVLTMTPMVVKLYVHCMCYKTGTMEAELTCNALLCTYVFNASGNYMFYLLHCVLMSVYYYLATQTLHYQ